MLRVSEDQRGRLRAAAGDAFIAEQVGILKSRHPQQWGVLGDDRGRGVIEFGIGRAVAHGYSMKGSVRLWLQLMFLFGSYFDEDPLFPEAARPWIACADPERQPRFAAELHKIACEVVAAVGGEGNVHNRAFLKSLAASVDDRRFDRLDTLEADLLSHLEGLHPRRMEHLGPIAHKAQIARAVQDAEAQGFDAAHTKALFAILAYIFGSGFWRDPLYPWVVDALDMTERPDPAVRAALLERRARTYLRAVIDNLGIA